MTTKASDPTIHQQLQEYVEASRRSVAGSVASLAVEIFDDEKNAFATMNVFSISDEKRRTLPVPHQLSGIILLQSRALQNLLIMATRGRLEVVIRDKQTGSIVNPSESLFGTHVAEIKL